MLTTGAATRTIWSPRGHSPLGRAGPEGQKMSTDKLETLHSTVAEILSGPASPPTFFDEEPSDASQASEQVAKASDDLRRGPDFPKVNFGKSTSREPGISAKEIEHIVRDAENESPGM